MTQPPDVPALPKGSFASQFDGRTRVLTMGQTIAYAEAYAADKLAQVQRDALRLDWLLHMISGKELRLLGVITAGDKQLDRSVIDAAMKDQP